jgi:ABC-type transport system involved in multi-copper enzyme maturation permease subunit
MGNAVKAEFRKIFSTKMWWALLIPAAAVSLLVNLGLALAVKGGEEVAGVSVPVPVALISLGISFTFTAIFAAIFGAMAISGEFRHRTISTTYLTSASRGTVLTAKLVAYTGLGLIYGVVTLGCATIGAVAGDGSNALPSGGSWLLLSLVGIVVIALWTLLGVGVGGLISNQIAAVVVLLAYSLAGEAILGVVLSALKWTSVGFYLPRNAASDTVVEFSFDQFIKQAPGLSGAEINDVKTAFGALGAPSWGVSGLVFIAYAAAFTFLGWAISRRKDIT